MCSPLPLKATVSAFPSKPDMSLVSVFDPFRTLAMRRTIVHRAAGCEVKVERSNRTGRARPVR